MSSITDALKFISPDVGYADWIKIGMALHQEGYPLELWDSWSSQGDSYTDGCCDSHWESFGSYTGPLITAGTIYEMAKQNGYIIPDDPILDWVDGWYDDPDIVSEQIPYLFDTWDPVKEITTYLTHIFEPDERVCYVTESELTDKGKWAPAGLGSLGRTREQLIDEIKDNCSDEDWIGYTIGYIRPEAGMWICINPVDGKGRGWNNITSYRYALVESDEISKERQLQLYKELNLPIACLVDSGGKSIHALVKIYAKDRREYTDRVRQLFEICEEAGLKIDQNNKNAGRLSRLPGIQRGSKRQRLIALDMGAPDFETWIGDLEDEGLPEIENSEDFFEEEIALDPELIEGVLRAGRKMIISGPPKAGKSFALLELTAAVTQGGAWFGWPCRKGRVLYINLENPGETSKLRIREVYQNLGYAHNGLLDTLNWRGVGKNLEGLKRSIIKRAQRHAYSLIILDPIYKVLTGDENNATDMARFTGMMDEICEGTGAALVYCHHFAKGSQSGKNSIDRASGSGVFARDADAILTLTQLEVPVQKKGKLMEAKLIPFLEGALERWDSESLMQIRRSEKWIKPEKGASQADWDRYYKERSYPNQYMERLKVAFDEAVMLTTDDDYEDAASQIEEMLEDIEAVTAWRLETSLREFRSKRPVNMYFQWPLHPLDPEGWLKDSSIKEAGLSQSEMQTRQEHKYKDRKNEDMEILKSTLEDLMEETGQVLLSEVVKEMSGMKRFSRTSILRRIDEMDEYDTEEYQDGRKTKIMIVRSES